MNNDVAKNSHFQEVNGINLYYVTWGEFTRPERAVLLVHGVTANCQQWAKFGPALAEKGWFAIAPDLRGRGQSDKPPHGYGIPFHVNDLLTLCDALGLSRMQLIGHSLGAQIGYFFAAIHPERLNRLVLVDAGARVPADALQALAPTLQRLGQVYPSIDAYLEERKQSPVYTWNAFWEEYFRYDAEIHPDGTVTSRIPRSVLEEELKVNMVINTDMLLPRIQAPTLIMRAALGTLAPDKGFILPAEEAERVRGIIKSSQVVAIPDTNHYTIGLSDDFNREALAFLAAGE